MLLFLSRLFVVGFIITSSVYAGAPAAWCQDPGNPMVMHIVDADGAVIDSKILKGESCGDKVLEIDGVLYILPMQTKANDSAIVLDDDVEMSENEFEICPHLDSDTDVEMSEGGESPDPEKSASSSAPDPTVWTYEEFFRDLRSSDSETDSDSEQVSAGQKRAKSDAPRPTKKARQSKYAGVAFEKVVYWRINPDQAGEFQLCDAESDVLYTGTVRYGKAGKERVLKHGYLEIKDTHNTGKYYCFSRDPKDTTVLEDHGFVEGSDESFRAYDAARKAGQSKYKGVEFDKVAYWRINPDQAGEFQLCDAEGEVLYTGTVRYGKVGKERVLQGGYLEIVYATHNAGTYHKLKRDPKDTTVLEDHGFVEGSDESFRAYDAARKAGRSKYKGVEFDKVAYWRINPDQAGEFQLCDAEGDVLYTGSVRYGKAGKERVLNNGCLEIKDTHNTKKHYCFSRDPKDTTVLEDHGFVEGQKALVWVDPIVAANDTFSSFLGVRKPSWRR